MSSETGDDRITGGEDVVDSTGQKVGSVAYIVVRPPEMQITDIVVCTGALLGRDVVVPTSDVTGLSDGRVHLSIDKNQLKTYEDYIEIHYEQPPETWAETGGPFSPVQSVLWPSGSYYPQPSSTTIHAPEGTVGIREGMDVMSSDGEKVGSVHAVDADHTSGEVKAIIVRYGHLSKHDVGIPCENIAEIAGDSVRLTITKDEAEALTHRSE